MPNQHSPRNPAPRRCRQVRFTDAEWAELQAGAQAIGETRSEAIRAGGLSRVRQAIPDASDVIQAQPWAAIVSAGALPKPAGRPVNASDVMTCAACALRKHLPDCECGCRVVPDVTPAAWTVDGAEFSSQNWNPAQPDPIAGPIPDGWTMTKIAMPTQVFACAYCPAEFATEFDAEAHIDNLHPEK